jgi:hypothetical protein
MLVMDKGANLAVAVKVTHAHLVSEINYMDKYEIKRL